MTTVEALEVDYEEPQTEQEPTRECVFCSGESGLSEMNYLRRDPSKKLCARQRVYGISHREYEQGAVFREMESDGEWYVCEGCIDVFEADSVLPGFEDITVCDRCEIETEPSPSFQLFESRNDKDMSGEKRHFCEDCRDDLGLKCWDEKVSPKESTGADNESVFRLGDYAKGSLILFGGCTIAGLIQTLLAFLTGPGTIPGIGTLFFVGCMVLVVVISFVKNLCTDIVAEATL